MKNLIIRAIKTGNSYQMVAGNGDLPQEGLLHKTVKSVYKDCAAMYPYNSTWQGKKIRGGYQIVID